MAIRPDWMAGTLNLVAGTPDFTTTGSALQTAAIQAGDAIITATGYVLIIAEITGQNSGRLFDNCPVAAAGDGQPLRVRYQPDGSRVQAAVRMVRELLTTGNLEAFAALIGEEDAVPVFVGPGVMKLVPKSEFGPDDTKGNLAALAALENMSNLSELAAIAKANNQFIIMGADGTIAPMPINDLIDDIGADISTLQSSVSSLSVMVDAYRLILTSDVTINVSTSGADANGSLTNPFKTIGAALSFIYRRLDLNSYSVTIKIADGTYAENIKLNGKPVGSGVNNDTHPISLIGNTSSPNLVKIGLGSGTTLDVKNQAFVSISGLNFIQSDYSISVRGSGSTVAINGKVEFEKQEYDHIASSAYSVIDIFADYTILGGGMNHIHSTEGGAIFYHGTRTITVENNPNFWGQFAGCAFAVMQVMNTSFVGTATGRRFLCHFNGEIRTGTDNRQLFPGSISGALMTGGKFDAVPFNSVTKTTNQSLVQNVPTLVSWDDTVANVNHMMIEFYKLVPSAGYCSISATLSFEGLTAGQTIYAILYKNGQSYKVASKLAQSSYDAVTIISPDEPVNDGDYFQVYAQYSGNSGVIRGNPSLTYMSARQI